MTPGGVVTNVTRLRLRGCSSTEKAHPALLGPQERKPVPVARPVHGPVGPDGADVLVRAIGLIESRGNLGRVLLHTT
jgi:hypothetical protein